MARAAVGARRTPADVRRLLRHGDTTRAEASLRSDDALVVLHATATSAGAIVRGVRIEDGAIVIDASPEPFGLVLHLPGGAA